ncbi:acyl-CoA dehydrogenase family protein [Paenibacillus chitinolyticus]|uniref:acyl-CoA dehydrogenase family protein n=1 Tax=Paenibacillus chitinolyticus TaxID=79263 RepID=UPI00364E5B83
MTDRRVQGLLDRLHELRPYAKTAEDIACNVNWLVSEGCHTWFHESGSLGAALGPGDYAEFMSSLASRCPHTALGFSMHAYTVRGLWPVLSESQQAFLRARIEGDGALLGALNDPNLYFIRPSGLDFGSFPLRARSVEDGSGGYRLSGTKKFVSLEPFVSYLPLYALAEEKGGQKRIVILLIDKNRDSVVRAEDWDSIAMGGTFSNSLSFEDAYIPQERVIYEGAGAFSETALLAYWYRLSKASVYLGMARLAMEQAETACRSHKVPHTGRSLGFFPGVQFTLAEMVVLVETSLSQIARLCTLMDGCLQKPADAAARDRETNVCSLVTMQYVLKASESVVNLAMKIAGVSSLSSGHTLSSLYTDVKAGQFHAPQPDIAAELIAKDKLGIVPVRSRWV